MPETDRNDESSISKGQSSSTEGTSSQSKRKERFVTDGEWDDLLEDAKQFKNEHASFFRRLSKR